MAVTHNTKKLIPMGSAAAQLFPGISGSWSRGNAFISENTNKCVSSTGNLCNYSRPR